MSEQATNSARQETEVKSVPVKATPETAQTQPKRCNCLCHNQSAKRTHMFRHLQLKMVRPKHKFKSRRDCLRALMAIRR